MGALISLRLVWERNDVFSKAACLSAPFKIDSLDYITTVATDSGQRQMTLYIDNGSIGVDKRLQPGIDEMIQVLENKGYQAGVDFYWYHVPGAEHNEQAWLKRFWRPLQIFFSLSP
jgi:predicted alpha/beta superfamily hydrolase